jgi:hypothetical protein
MPLRNFRSSWCVARELANELRDFIPNLSRDYSLATLNLVAGEVNMSRHSGDGYLQLRRARASVQIAGLASNSLECKSGQV